MKSAKLLNSDASLNHFEVLESVQFIPDSAFDIVFRLFQVERDIRYIPPVTNITTVKIPLTDGTTLDLVASIVDIDDRSIVKVSITALQSQTIVGGNIVFELDLLGDATVIEKGIVYNALSVVTEGC